jgi:hypothetical protein
MSTESTGGLNRPRELKCDLCGRIFNSEASLDEHKRLEHGETSEPPVGVG